MPKGRHITATLAMATFAGLAVPRAEAQLSSRVMAVGLPTLFESPIEVLRDASQADSARLAAARTLLQRSEDPDVRGWLAEELVLPLAGTGGGGYILQAIESSSDAPPRLFPILAQRLASTGLDELPRFLAAIASFRTRDAARLLVLHTGPEQPPEIASAAFDALARLTGQGDILPLHDAWAEWLAGVEPLTESQWRLSLASSMARRADDLAVQRRVAVVKLLDTYRRLHLSTPPEQRGSLLAELLLDPTPEVQDLGFELTARELSAGSQVGPAVATAAVALMSSPQPRVRERAATLVRQVAPDDAGPRVAAALAGERQPSVAGAMLLAAARWPLAEVIEPALRWLPPSSGASHQAASACAALAKSGQLHPAEQVRVLETLRTWPAQDFDASACWLLASLGDEADLERLRPALESGASPLRISVAESLVWYPQFTRAIVDAARTDPALFEVAARAMLVQGPDATSLRTLLALPQPAPETARPAVVSLAAALPSADLWDVASQQTDLSLRRALLTLLTSDSREMSAAVNDASREAIGKGVLALVDLQFQSAEADAALATIESSPFVPGGTAEPPYPPPEGLPRRRVTALVAMNRLEPAALAGLDADAWLDGLSLAAKRPWAADVVGAIEDRFASTLTEAQKARLTVLKAGIAPARASTDAKGEPK